MEFKKIASATSLALTAFGATAQSTVQVYGIVDAGLVYANRVRSGAVGSAESDTYRLESGNAASSRIGFRGREDLGSGLSALFVLENGTNLDVGTQANGGRLFGRAAYVGISDKTLGELQFGRQITTIYDFGLVFDPVAPARFSTPVFDAAYVGRADNAMKYIGKFGGLNVRTQYSFGYDGTVANGGEQPIYRIGKQAGIHADHTIGDVTLGAAWDRQNGTSVATQKDKNVHVDVGVAWNIRPVTLYAAYARQRVTTPGRTVATKLYWVAARFRPTPNVSLAPGVYFNDPEGVSNRSVMFTVFATYDLSKRTDLYTQIGYMKNQANATIGMVGSVNPGHNQVATTLGLRHRF